MSNGYKQLVLAWALIVAQLFVVVIGHGRIVICHDESGSTHIELVGDESCAVNSDQPCGLVDGSQEIDSQSLCADTACEDELFGLTYTLTNTRRLGQRVSSEFVPTNWFAIASFSNPDEWASIEFPLETVCKSVVHREQRLTLRSTVLIL